MKRQIILILLIIACIPSTFAQNTWIQKNDFTGNARSRAICFTIGSYSYYGTGNHFGGAAEANDVWRYDAISDTWTSISATPSGMQAAISSSTDNYGYVTCGWWSGTAHTDNYKYNPGTNTWSSVAAWNGNTTHDGVAIGIADELFVGTGGQAYSDNCWNDWQKYDETLNAWTPLTVTPGIDRRNGAIFQIDGWIYWGGGQLEFSGGQGIDFYRYNPISDSWSGISDCPSSATGWTRNSAFVLNGRGYLALPDGLWEYNPLNDSWDVFPMPYNDGLGVDAAFVQNGKAYIIKFNSKQVWEWTPCDLTPTSSSYIICDSYTAPDGQIYTSSGLYQALIPKLSECDSLYEIDLIVNHSSFNTLTQTSCNNYTAPDGSVYSSSGVYTSIIPNTAGCDSVITINLTVNQSSSSSISETACDQYIAPDAQVYTTSGNYISIIPNTKGCDSTITINLTIENSTNSTINASGIDSYTLNGQTYTASGTYTQVLLNEAGCDSTITLNLSLEYTGISENIESFSIFPNPSDGHVYCISTDALDDMFLIHDLDGRLVMSGTLSGTSTLLDLSDLENGVYIFRLEKSDTIIRLIKA